MTRRAGSSSTTVLELDGWDTACVDVFPVDAVLETQLLVVLEVHASTQNFGQIGETQLFQPDIRTPVFVVIEGNEHAVAEGAVLKAEKRLSTYDTKAG